MRIIISIALCLITSYGIAKDNNKEKTKVLTLSNGRYEEFFDQDSIERIGSVLYNVNTQKVIGFIEEGQNATGTLKPEIISRWLSIDPLASKYPSISPYAFVGNNPISNKEIDGRYWLDFNVCDFTFKHSKQHGGNYLMVTKVSYGYTSMNGLKALNYASAIPFAPEVSWTATASKLILAMRDNSVNFGASDWAGVALNIVGWKAGQYMDKSGQAALDLYNTTVSLTGEELQAFKNTDYYQLYLDGRAAEIMTADGTLTKDGFSQEKLQQWHEDGVRLVESEDKAFMKQYRVGKVFGVTKQGAPSEYVKDKVKETIEKARTQAAEELDKRATN